MLDVENTGWKPVLLLMIAQRVAPLAWADGFSGTNAG